MYAEVGGQVREAVEGYERHTSAIKQVTHGVVEIVLVPGGGDCDFVLSMDFGLEARADERMSCFETNVCASCLAVC